MRHWTDSVFVRTLSCSVNNHLASIDWLSIICDNPDAPDMWSSVTDVVFYIVSLYVPHRTSRNCEHSQKCYNRVYPKNIHKAFAAKLRCWRRYKANPEYALKLKYQRRAQNCKQLVKDHEKNCETWVLDTENIGAFYKFVNKWLGNKTGISPLYDESGKLIVDDCRKANLLNNYFSSVGTTEHLRARVGYPRFSSFREKRIWSLWSFQPSYAIHFLGYIYDYVVFRCRNRCPLWDCTIKIVFFLW